MAGNTTEQLVVQISADLSALRNSMSQVENILNQVANRSAQAGNKAGKNFANGFKTALGSLSAYFSMSFMKDLMKQGIEAYADLETSVKKFDRVFQGHAGNIIQWAEQMAKATGLSVSTLQGYVADVGDMFMGFGMGAEKASQFSESIVQMALDLQAVNQTMVKTKEEAIKLVQSGLVGNFEAFRRLGIQINEAVLKQQMFEMGLKGTFAQLDQNTKMLVIYGALYKQYMGQGAMGASAESLNTVNGQLSAMGDRFKELMQVLGYGLLPAFQVLGFLFSNVLAPAVMWVAGSIRWLSQVIAENQGLQLLLAFGISVLARNLIVLAYTAIAGAVSSMWQYIVTAYQSFNASLAAASGMQVVGVACKALFSTVLPLVGIMLLLVSLFSSFGKSGSKGFSLPKIATPADLAKGMPKGAGAGGSGGQKKANKKVVDQEKQLNDKLREAYNDRVKDYSKVTKILLGVQRKFITAKDILIASEQSKIAIQQFNQGIAKLEARLGSSELGRKFVEQLKSLDPDEYVDYIQALNRAGDSELQQIVANFGTRHKEAMVTAERAVQAEKPSMARELQKVGNAVGTGMGEAFGTAIGNTLGAAMTDIQTNLQDSMTKWQQEMDKILSNYEWFGLKASIEKAFVSLGTKVRNFVNTLPEWLKKGLVPNYSKNYDGSIDWDRNPATWGDREHHFAKGGIFTGYSRLGNAIFGEAGHEAVIPLSPKGLRPFAEAISKYTNMGSNIYIQNMNVRNDGDIKRIAYELKRLQDADNRNKGYGYGY